MDGVCGQYGYRATIDGAPNPQTKAQFARAQLAKWVKDSVKAYEATTASESARSAAVVAADSQITVT